MINIFDKLLTVLTTFGSGKKFEKQMIMKRP